MVIGDCEMNSQGDQGEVESALQMEHNQSGMKSFSSLGRQSSIYSLTLDEFQHTLVSENGKNFGSMNMDEFLTSIWNAEDNINQPINNHNHNNNMSLTETTSAEKDITTIRKQPSLPRQGSLTLPAPLSRKTVEQVWSEIHQHQQYSNNNNNGNVQNTESAPRQPTFGEMTLEDFLVKAGVVRETCAMNPAPVSHQQQQYGVFTNNNTTMPPFVIGGGVGNVVAPPYTTVAQGGGELGNGKKNSTSGYHPPPPPPPPGICFPGGGGGYGVAMAPPHNIGIGGPVSPASSNENSAGQFGIEMRGRKRMVDGPVEKVVERRQRRMIKNRESAARSRARKQAYTVELEAELNILREENNQLKQALVLLNNINF
ncbi:putative transcription factor bZIP family [Lupinus albus]|uniref:Putative transcription factor bZIP family n=1 Tax=Lupinus albus TaxID=3870 RepID=A0A6A4N4X5_LUPAL|nr:putative transcription factor bZIP family [Lupinus albus]